MTDTWSEKVRINKRFMPGQREVVTLGKSKSVEEGVPVGFVISPFHTGCLVDTACKPPLSLP